MANRGTLGRLDYIELIRAVRRFNVTEYGSNPEDENQALISALDAFGIEAKESPGLIATRAAVEYVNWWEA